jgi:hypothetical protein
VWFGFTSGRNQDATGIFVAVAESFFPRISSGLVAHSAATLVAIFLLALANLKSVFTTNRWFLIVFGLKSDSIKDSFQEIKSVSVTAAASSWPRCLLSLV